MSNSPLNVNLSSLARSILGRRGRGTQNARQFQESTTESLEGISEQLKSIGAQPDPSKVDNQVDPAAPVGEVDPATAAVPEQIGAMGETVEEEGSQMSATDALKDMLGVHTPERDGADFLDLNQDPAVKGEQHTNANVSQKVQHAGATLKKAMRELLKGWRIQRQQQQQQQDQQQQQQQQWHQLQQQHQQQLHLQQHQLDAEAYALWEADGEMREEDHRRCQGPASWLSADEIASRRRKADALMKHWQ